MKIIHANKYYYNRAGAENYMLRLMALQEEEGHQVVPFAMHYPKNIKTFWSDYFVSEIETESGVSRGFLGKFKQLRRAWWSREAYIKMSKMIDVFNPEVVHIHNIYTQISPSILKACAKHKVPVVMTVHDYALVCANYSLWNKDRNMNPKELGILKTARSKFIKNSYLATLILAIIQRWHQWRKAYDKHINHYFASSQFVKDVLVASGYNKNKISVLFPFFGLESDRVKRRDAGYVLFVGRLEIYKGVQTLIQAMRDFPGVTLKIAGLGSYEKDLRALAKGMKNVEFIGWISGKEKDELQAGARVSVLPSIWNEPAGIVIFESLAQGVPVIVSDAGGMKEIVEDRISGRVFKAGDVQDLSRVLKEFLSDKKYADSISEAALQRAEEIGNPDSHLDRVMDVYRNILVRED